MEKPHVARVPVIVLLVTILVLAHDLRAADAIAARPNIVLIYADDLGYGDLSCYGATALETPNADRLAREGLRFTDGHCSSSTCTPSRYSMITGQYAFRKKGTGILPGDAALIVPTDRATLPGILANAGYTTGIVGKWHLGLGNGTINWNKEVKPGPHEVGFHESFIMPATGDRVPCVYLENQRVVGVDPADPIEISYKDPFPGEPTGVTARDRLKMDWKYGHNMAVVRDIGRIGYMRGGKRALWKDELMAEVFTQKAVEFIERHRRQPFFLLLATHDIHVPRVPHPRFIGKTTMGPRGDAILEFDWTVGEIVNALDRLNLSENTLVLLSSDNGPVLGDGYKDEAEERLGDHKPAGPLRGGKGTIWEGGTRVPFLARWPKRIRPGVSDALVSQVDFCATFAAWTSQQLTANDAPDSVNVLPALLGESSTGREFMLEHSGVVALREGTSKLIPKDQKSGGGYALYDLKQDLGETTDVAAQHPDLVDRLAQRLQHLRGTNEK